MKIRVVRILEYVGEKEEIEHALVHSAVPIRGRRVFGGVTINGGVVDWDILTPHIFNEGDKDSGSTGSVPESNRPGGKDS